MDLILLIICVYSLLFFTILKFRTGSRINGILKFISQIISLPLTCFFVFGFIASYDWYPHACINRFHLVYLALFIMSSYMFTKFTNNKYHFIISLIIIMLLLALMAYAVIGTIRLEHGMCFKF